MCRYACFCTGRRGSLKEREGNHRLGESGMHLRHAELSRDPGGTEVSALNENSWKGAMTAIAD